MQSSPTTTLTSLLNL
ncbi:hypothetical protein ACHAWC_007001 [Mediolabrus comicus]